MRQAECFSVVPIWIPRAPNCRGLTMAKTQTTQWDPAEHLETDEDIAAYLEATLEEGNPALVAAALGDFARAKGMTQLARETGLGREPYAQPDVEQRSSPGLHFIVARPPPAAARAVDSRQAALRP